VGWREESIVANVPPDITRVLGPGEQVELYIQQKIYHPKINIDSVVLTSQRIILRHPHDLGLKKDFTDFNYTDVANAILDKGILRSTVKITLRFGGDPLNLADLPNSDAEKAYGIIRSNISRFQAPFSTGYATMAPVMPMGMAQQQPPQMQGTVCSKCGARSAAGTRFCGSCGNQL
jgi:ribosomal protein L40E